MSSEKGPKYIYAQEHKLHVITITITWEGIEKIKNKKKTYQMNVSFTNAVRKGQQTLYWLLNFDWLPTSYDYLTLTFHWFISAG